MTLTAPNDWPVARCLRLSAAVVLAMCGLVGLEAIGLGLPGIRQAVGFVFLTLVPGVLLLRVLRVHGIGLVQSTLYSVGLSVAFVYVVGLGANFALPPLGLDRPISTLPITASITAALVLLGWLAYRRDKGFEAPQLPQNALRFSPWYLFFLLLPLLAVLGALFVNFYRDNSLLLAFFPVVVAVGVLAAFGRLPRYLFVVAVASVAVAILLQGPLVSSELRACDIHQEYNRQYLVLQAGRWDPHVPGNLNTTLAIVLLAPIYSVVMNIDTVWVFKVAYPLIFALVPVALFLTYRRQIGPARALFAALFFMAIPPFLVRMTALPRQEIAELFFALMLLLFVEHSLARRQKYTLAGIFSLGIIVSHYALGYIFMLFLVAGWLLLWLIRSRYGRRLWRGIARRQVGLPEWSRPAFPHRVMAVLIMVYVCAAVGWYGTVAQGSALKTITNIGQQQVSDVTTTETDTEYMPREKLVLTAIGADFPEASGWGKAFRVFQYLTEIFIIIGFLATIAAPRRFNIRLEYTGLTIVAGLILLACIVLPGFSSYLDVTRFYHISLFLVAPYCVLGGETVWSGLTRLTRVVDRDSESTPYAHLRVFAILLLAPYLLFTSGFVFEITRSETYLNEYDLPWSWSLSTPRVDTPVFTPGEGVAAEWLTDTRNPKWALRGDRYGGMLLRDLAIPHTDAQDLTQEAQPAYVFLRSLNIQQQEWLTAELHGAESRWAYMELDEVVAPTRDSLPIYANGQAQVWIVPDHTLGDSHS
jgi:uncharacterized membrane protein